MRPSQLLSRPSQNSRFGRTTLVATTTDEIALVAGSAWTTRHARQLGSARNGVCVEPRDAREGATLVARPSTLVRAHPAWDALKFTADAAGITLELFAGPWTEVEFTGVIGLTGRPFRTNGRTGRKACPIGAGESWLALEHRLAVIGDRWGGRCVCLSACDERED